jgi:hypothetical protein
MSTVSEMTAAFEEYEKEGLNVIPRQRCIFVATFSDGVVVSTPTAWNGGNPSVERAKFFSELAYKRQIDKSAPAIVEAHFEVGRKPRTVLRVCSAAELDVGQAVTATLSEPEPEAGGVNDLPDIVPVATPNDALVEAIKTLRAAGYRVSKPRKQKNPKRGTDRVGPTCVAIFADGEVTRMSTYTSLEQLDWERGLRLSQAAYESRWRTRVRVHGVPPLSALPPIVSAYFERDGIVLAQRKFERAP